MIAERLRLPTAGALTERPDDDGATVARFGRARLGLVDTAEGFEALGPAWSALFARAAAPHQVFQTFEWLWTWYRHYREPGLRLAIVTGHVEGDLALVLPLVVRRRAGLRVLSFMGEPVGQYGDAVFDAGLSDADQDAALAFALRLPADVVSLRRVRADAAIAPLLRRRLGAPTTIEHAPFVDFTGAADVAAFEARYSGKLRSNRRRHLRRLADQGAIAFQHHGASFDAEVLVAIAMTFKRDWARRSGVIAPAIADPRFEQFFRAAARGDVLAPTLRVSAVSCADDIVGVEISVTCKGRLFGHVLAPGPRLEKLGVGGILAGHAITSALEQGYAAYDTLAPADAYKREWTTDTVAVGDHAVARTLVGALYTRVWLGFGRGVAKRLAKRLQASRRRGPRRA